MGAEFSFAIWEKVVHLFKLRLFRKFIFQIHFSEVKCAGILPPKNTLLWFEISKKNALRIYMLILNYFILLVCRLQINNQEFKLGMKPPRNLMPKSQVDVSKHWLASVVTFCQQ